MVLVLGHLSAKDEIFSKDYVPSPVRKRKEDLKVISMPSGFLKGLPLKPISKQRKRTRLRITQNANSKIKEMRQNEKKSNLKLEIEMEKDKRV